MLPKNQPPPHPGELLLDTLTEMEMTQVELAKKLGVSIQTVNTLIRGKRSMTARMAVGLARVFKASPEMWMNLQTNRDLWFALHAKRRSAAHAEAGR